MGSIVPEKGWTLEDVQREFIRLRKEGKRPNIAGKGNGTIEIRWRTQ